MYLLARRVGRLVPRRLLHARHNHGFRKAAVPNPAHVATRRTDTLSRYEEKVERFLQHGQAVRMADEYLAPRERVFANHTTRLGYVDWYGFDFDYTFVTYTEHVQDLIYREARDYLVKNRGYPAALRQLTFNPSFAIRGLHYDSETGYLLKVDEFGRILDETVHFGHQKVDLYTILDVYEGLRLSNGYINRNLHMMQDLFCLPEATLLADVTQLFKDHGIQHAPRYLFNDVAQAIQHVHLSGKMHESVKRDPARFFKPKPYLKEYLRALRKGGKKIFILTNSHFDYVDAGMRHVLKDYTDELGQPWWEVFDIVICSAQKPTWYDKKLPFRAIDPATGRMSFEAVTSLQPGRVLTEGGMQEFHRLTGARAERVLYFGDHIMNDLVQPARAAQWRTVAIISEIKHELDQQHTPEYADLTRQLLTAENLILHGQALEGPGLPGRIEALKARRRELREGLFRMFNPHFGSVFRTYTHRTAFFNDLCRYCDLYTGSVSNFARYPLDYTFYARREWFPHEEGILREHRINYDEPSAAFPA